jgi:fatty-acyl-CoA synthase
VKKRGRDVTKQELLGFFDGKIAKWWTPDDVLFVDTIALGATGKDAEKQAARAVRRLPAADRLSA